MVADNDESKQQGRKGIRESKGPQPAVAKDNDNRLIGYLSIFVRVHAAVVKPRPHPSKLEL